MKNNIGKRIYGYCNGFFGRDDYNDKIIIFETAKAIVCMYADSYRGDAITVANFDSEEEKNSYVAKWAEEDWDEENDEY